MDKFQEPSIAPPFSSVNSDGEIWSGTNLYQPYVDSNGKDYGKFIQLLQSAGENDLSYWDESSHDPNTSFDRIVVIEMDNKDLAVSDININPTDAYVGALGEGTREVEVTVTNTGMDILNGQATLDVEIKEVDEAASTNVTVYAMDWDNPEDRTGCGTAVSYTHLTLPTNREV